MSLAHIRSEYRRAELHEADTHKNPLVQFRIWFDEAVHSEVLEPNAMCLATATPDASPSARMVLMKGVDESGVLFFTDYRSRKGQELEENPHAALCFFWPELERSVRMVGAVQRVSRADSNEYFQSRPRESRLGAWTSHQSEEIESRDTLDVQLAEVNARFPDGPVPLPDHWGGFRIEPTEIEFWQGRRSRLHDRIQYVRQGNEWLRRRLSP